MFVADSLRIENTSMQELLQLTNRVWIYPHDPDPLKVQPSVGVIMTSKQTILVDSGNSPRHARQILAALATIDAPPIDYVIFTHHHWDHTFGAAALGAPAIIGHENCATHLKPLVNKVWSHTLLREEVYKNPRLEARNTAIGRVIDDWRSFRICVPNVSFNHTLSLHLDEVTLHIEHVGGKHADDSLIVRVAEDGVMFLGDCFYPRSTHERFTEEDSQPDLNMAARLLEDDCDLYIHSHDRPRTLEEMRQTFGG